MELHDLVLFPSERVHHSNGTEPLLGLCEHRAFLFLNKRRFAPDAVSEKVNRRDDQRDNA